MPLQVLLVQSCIYSEPGEGDLGFLFIVVPREARQPSVWDINVGECRCVLYLRGKEQGEGKSERNWADEVWTS